MNSIRRRLVFAGSPEFALPGLRAIADSRHELLAVLTQPDRPAGRGRRLVPGPVKQLAQELEVPVLQPTTLKSDESQAALRNLSPDLIVVIAYGLLLPPAVLSIPRRGCVNVHASLLPRWRGASPIQAAVLHGDAQTGVCLMQLEAGLDTGPVFACRQTEIAPQETAGELHNRLARLGGELLAEYLDAVLEGQVDARPQREKGVTYAGRIDKADAVIDWQQDATAIQRQVLAYNPWPVAETLLDGQRMRIWRAQADMAADHDQKAGRVIDAGGRGVCVAAGKGRLWLTEVQMPGRRRMPAADFARGSALLGKQLGS
jgi:methionyl-tRNA formyltransferase